MMKHGRAGSLAPEVAASHALGACGSVEEAIGLIDGGPLRAGASARAAIVSALRDDRSKCDAMDASYKHHGSCSMQTRRHLTQTNRGSGVRGLCVLITLAIGSVPSLASAQTQPAPNEPAPAQPPVAPPTPATPEPAPAATPPAAGGTSAAPVAAPPAPAAKEPEKKWYDVINVGAFVDAYYSQNWNTPRPNAGANLYHPYTANTGFGLAWVGLDASVDPDPVGAVMQLRFGPAVPNLALGDFGIPGGIGFVQNGYVSWKPSGKDGKLTLIAGKFDTVYGAEVAQSHLNFNYTRGVLYNLAQPFFHTGLRADIQMSDQFALKLLAVNGWNNTIDNNQGKSFGAQFSATPAEGYTFSLGYMGGPEESDYVAAPPPTPGGVSPGNVRNVGADSRLRHLVDIVGDMKLTPDFRVVVNGDYVTQTVVDPTNNSDKSVSWFGAAVLARYAFSDVWAAAVRGELLRDKDGQISAPNTNPLTLYTGTLTLEAAPHKNLIIRLDNRLDAADEAVFSTIHTTSKTQFTTTLGIVAKTN